MERVILVYLDIGKFGKTKIEDQDGRRILGLIGILDKSMKCFPGGSSRIK